MEAHVVCVRTLRIAWTSMWMANATLSAVHGKSCSVVLLKKKQKTSTAHTWLKSTKTFIIKLLLTLWSNWQCTYIHKTCLWRCHFKLTYMKDNTKVYAQPLWMYNISNMWHRGIATHFFFFLPLSACYQFQEIERKVRFKWERRSIHSLTRLLHL